jgi:hypothetical protein
MDTIRLKGESDHPEMYRSNNGQGSHGINVEYVKIDDSTHFRENNIAYTRAVYDIGDSRRANNRPT